MELLARSRRRIMVEFDRTARLAAAARKGFAVLPLHAKFGGAAHPGFQLHRRNPLRIFAHTFLTNGRADLLLRHAPALLSAGDPRRKDGESPWRRADGRRRL